MIPCLLPGEPLDASAVSQYNSSPLLQQCIIDYQWQLKDKKSALLSLLVAGNSHVS